jgi:hypothetical protein
VERGSRRSVALIGGDVRTENYQGILRVLIVLLLAVTVASCSVVGGIFKAGVWVGVIIVLIVVGLLFALFGRRG